MLMLYAGAPVEIYDGQSHRFHPGWLLPEPESGPRPPRHTYTLHESFADCVREIRPRRVCFHRGYALGDILMLVPVIRALRRELEIPAPVLIAVQGRFEFQLRPLEMTVPDIRFCKSVGMQSYGCDIHVDLDHVLEVDHRGGPDSMRHRLELYGQALGVKVERA